jgi:HEAT repeat protein
MRFRLAACSLFACLALVSTGLPAAPDTSADERLLRSARLGTDGPALLDFLKKRVSAGRERDRIVRLVRQLAEAKGDQADRAFGELVAFGSTALAPLKEELKNVRPGNARPLLEECIKLLEGTAASDIPRAVIRLTARRKPEGAIPALLAYLGAAEDEEAVSDVRQALTALALRSGKPEPALLAAVKAADHVHHTVAAEALRAADNAKVARKLLRDPDANLRLRIALALMERGDAEAVPVLIALLAEVPVHDGQQALYALRHLAGPLAPVAPLNPDEASRKQCRDAWAAWWRDNDGAALLDYFRKRTPRVEADRAAELVVQLGSKSFRVRQQAEAELVKLRGLAVPLLERAAKAKDLDLRRRAERCLELIKSAPDAPQSAARVRLLALRKPKGATDVLLAYVPFADDQSVIDEVRQVLVALTREEAKGRAALAAALTDRAAIRRGVAAEALAEVGGNQHRPALRKLLQDSEEMVRFRVALRLAPRGEKQAVGVLIDLIDHVADEQVWQIEELLRRLAGDSPPATELGTTPADRRKCREAWAAWWKANEARADLARLRGAQTLLGYTLVSEWNPSRGDNDIVELGRDGKPRWKVEGLGYSFDFEVLPGSRLLCAEYNQHRVTERNFKGEILWQYKIPSPINCQRLPNGHTFIAAGSQVVIVDRQGNAVLKVERYMGIMAGQRMRDGQILLMNGGQLIRLDASGKELAQVTLRNLSNSGGMQATSNGHVLIAFYNENKVYEYTPEGKLVWEHETRSPNFATRLPNGNTLIGSQDAQSATEVDRAGKVVWEYKPGKGVWRVRRR